MSDSLDKQVRIIERWRAHPEKFVSEALGVKLISAQQLEALRLLGLLTKSKWKRARGLKLTKDEKAVVDKWGITIRSGKGTGKDAWLSWVFLWFMICWPDPKGLATANSGRQLKDVLWSEIAKWMKHSKKEAENGLSIVSEMLVHQSERLYLQGAKDTSFVSARTANVKMSKEEQGEVLSGFHSDNMILAVDEASGVPDGVFKPLETTMTGEMNISILIGNMTKSSGYFYDSHFKHDQFWIPLRWNSEESENVTAEFLEFQRKKYGRESNMYRMMVLGEPPLAEADALIPMEWILAAQEREIEPERNLPHRIGLDPGDGGDPTGLITRKGFKIDHLQERDSRYSDELAIWAQGIIDELDAYDKCMVDVIGVGNGVYSNMRRDGYKVMPIRVQETKSMMEPHRFSRRRDESWWNLRTIFELGLIQLPKDEEFGGLGEKLRGELSILKFNDHGGKIKVISKKELRSAGLASPNLGDALMMTTAHPEPRPRTDTDSYSGKNHRQSQETSWMAG